MYRSKGQQRRWPRSRAAGCLLWIVLLVVILIVLSVLFGGFQKGTKAGPQGPEFMIVNSSGANSAENCSRSWFTSDQAWATGR